MKVEPRGLLAAVLDVADDGMPRLAEVDADLVLASRLEGHFDQGRAVFGRKLAPLGPRQLGGL